MNATSNRPFINSHETLLIVDAIRGRQFIDETDWLGTITRTAYDAQEGTDSAIRFLRMDIAFLTDPNAMPTAPEDVTEEVAAAWVEEKQPDPDDCELPAFVEQSEAWENYVEAYRTEYGFPNDRPVSHRPPVGVVYDHARGM